MGEIGQARAFANLLVVMLRREGEGMVDPIGVSGHGRQDGDGQWRI
jgi:hypothetical protein